MTVQSTESQDGVKTEQEDGTTTEQEDQGQEGQDGVKTEKTEQDPQAQEDAKKSQQAKSAFGEIKSMQEKIDKGDSTKEEAPQWMQNDLKEKEEEESEEDRDARVIKKFKDDQAYEKIEKDLDLNDDECEKVNLTIESEMKLGKSKVEALNYALYKLGKPQSQQTEEFVKTTSFPMITPRKTEAKKEVLVKTDQDKAFVEMVNNSQGVKIE